MASLKSLVVDLARVLLLCDKPVTHTRKRRQPRWQSTQMTAGAGGGGAFAGNALGALRRGASSLAWDRSGTGAHRLEASMHGGVSGHSQ